MKFTSSDPVECPLCGHDNTHHGDVEVFIREKEDSPRGRRTLVSHRTTKVEDVAPMDRCPSVRRSGLRIEMFCEACGPVGSIVVVQHKGQTFIEWEP